MAASETVTNRIPSEQGRLLASDYLVRRHYFRWPEALPWLIAVVAYFVFPDRMTFGSQVLIMIMFAVSLDLILGYAGIVTLGHAAFFGIGAYTVALGCMRLGWSEPITGIIAGGLVAGLVAFLYLRRRTAERGFLAYLGAGATPGGILLLAEVVARVGGAQLFDQARTISPADSTAVDYFGSTRVNHALIVLFAVMIVALLAYGRALPRKPR